MDKTWVPFFAYNGQEMMPQYYYQAQPEGEVVFPA